MPEIEQPIRWVVHFKGRVQGVGFRYTASQVAQSHPVQGYVRNLPDGRVELVGEGKASDLKALVAAVQKEMAGHIREAQVNEQAATGEFPDFRVRH